jgi:Asp/Glu/hydantoin racemase
VIIVKVEVIVKVEGTKMTEPTKEQLQTVYVLRQCVPTQQGVAAVEGMMDVQPPAVFGDLQAAIETAVRLTANRKSSTITITKETEFKWANGFYTVCVAPAKLHWKSTDAELLEDAEKKEAA